MALDIAVSTESSNDLMMKSSSSSSAAFESHKSSNNGGISNKFMWPEKDLVPAVQELQESVVDLRGFFNGDKDAILEAANLIRASCLEHGFFQVVNHGVDSDLIKIAHDQVKAFFVLPTDEKMKGEAEPGSRFGYSFAHSYRYSSKLPWKEIITFGYSYDNSDGGVTEFFQSKFGRNFEEMGRTLQKYCEAMKKLSLVLMEVIGISLGVNQAFFKEFFEDGNAIMRANCYPICPNPSLTLGVGPHNDPTSLTILHQDEVGGLEVFIDNQWKSVRPRNDALVINIGDTFAAMTNGIYKSCLHRVIVNEVQDRISLTYFLNPKDDKVVKPPKELISKEEPRKYPNFTWDDYKNYTFKQYRSDGATFDNFVNWLISSSKN